MFINIRYVLKLKLNLNKWILWNFWYYNVFYFYCIEFYRVVYEGFEIVDDGGVDGILIGFVVYVF